MSPRTVQVACVAENRADWYRRVEALAISLRNFGGQLAEARFVAHFVGGVDDDESRLLRQLGVDLRDVPPYPAPKPTTNKLRMFEDFAREPDAELLVALDCDTVVVGDFLAEATDDAVAAVPARTSPLDAGGWERLLTGLGLAVPPSPTVMFQTGEAVPAPYMNSGVLLVPRRHADALVTAWTAYVDRFAADARAGVREPWTGYMMDQVALACAFLEREIPVRALGLHVNVSTALNATARRERAEALRGGDVRQVKLLHYHRHISEEGLLLATDEGSPLNDVSDRVNSVVQSRRSGSVRRTVPEPATGGRSRAARFLSRRTP